MASGSEISSLYVRIGADTTGLEQGVARAKASLSGMSTAASSAAKAIAGAGLAAAAAVGGIIAFARSGFDAIDSMAKFADSIGISTEALTGLRYAAQTMAGVASEKLDSALQNMTRKINEAASGSGQASDALKALGLSASELARLSPDQQFYRIADAMRGVGNQADRVRATIAIFDRSSLPLVNALAQGSQAIKEAQAQAKSLGLTISRLDAAKIEAANDAYARFGYIVDSIRQNIAVGLAPVLTALSEKINAGSINVKNFGDWTVATMRLAAKAVSALMDAYHGLEISIKGIEIIARLVALGVAKSMQAATAAIAALGQFAVDALNKAISKANNIPGINIPVMQVEESEFLRSLGEQIKDAEAMLLSAELDFQNLVDAPSALSTVDKFFEEVEQRSQALNETLGGIVTPSESRFSGSGDKEAQKKKDRLNEELKKLQLYVATAGEIETSEALERQAKLAEIFQAGLVEREKFYGLSEQLAIKHSEGMAAISDSDFQAAMSRNQQLYESGILGLQEYYAAQQQAVIEHQQALTEIELAAYQERLDLLAQAYEDNQVTEEERRQRELELAQEHADKLAEIQQHSAAAQSKIAKDEAREREAQTGKMWNNLVSLMNSGNKEMFMIGKVAAIAQATLAAGESIQDAYKWGTKLGGPAMGAAAAATAAAATAAQIASIASTQFGGGGGVRGGSYSKPTDAIASGPVQAEQQQKPSQTVTISIGDGIYSGKAVRDLISAINDAVGDGARLRVA